jgi:ADP-L-glycero-D-manno-heptose 6-epimerase
MIVITGGSGFIGSALTWKFNQANYKNLMIVDEFDESQKWKNLLHKNFINFIPKSEFLLWLQETSHAKKISMMFHMGACSDTTENNMAYLFENNVVYSQKLFARCAELEIPFVYASSAATYGKGVQGYSDAQDRFLSLEPINPYGFSKQMFDSWVTQQTKTPPFWAGLKFFNVYGPNEYHKEDMKSIVTKAVPQILQTGKLKLFKSYVKNIGHGQQKRDFVYIKDVVDLMYYLWVSYKNTHNSLHSGIYNVGTGKAETFEDLGQAVFSALDKKPQFEWIEMPENIRYQYQYFTEADLTNLRSQTNYQKEFVSLEEGVHDYVRHYLMSERRYL